jgi:dihydropteroate synthase
MLLANLSRFNKIAVPLLVGISRKSMIGALLDDAAADQRLYGSLAAAVMAYEHGAKVLRVHDVKETVDALKIADAVLRHSRD